MLKGSVVLKNTAPFFGNLCFVEWNVLRQSKQLCNRSRNVRYDEMQIALTSAKVRPFVGHS